MIESRPGYANCPDDNQFLTSYKKIPTDSQILSFCSIFDVAPFKKSLQGLLVNF